MDEQNRVSALARWEDATGLFGSLRAMVAVCGMALFRPVEFFYILAHENTDIRKRLVRAFIFAAVLGYLQLFCDAVGVLWLKHAAAGRDFIPEFRTQLLYLGDAFFTSPFVALRPLIIWGVGLAFVGAGIKLVLGVQRVLIPAFLVLCYKSAAQVFCMIPVFGGLLASVWSIAILVIGIRTLYRVGMGRSMLACIVIPSVVLISGMLAMGPSLSRVIVAFYPEAQIQMMVLNDASAKVTATAVVRAAEDYKKELGFYPVHFGLLRKYLPPAVADEFGDTDIAAGYVYLYRRSDEQHFVLDVIPLQKDVTGSLHFTADQTGRLTQVPHETDRTQK
jgi:hypothetical protein